jgi:hypothetical protein
MKFRNILVVAALGLCASQASLQANATTTYDTWTFDLNKWLTTGDDPDAWPSDDLVFSSTQGSGQLDATVTGWVYGESSNANKTHRIRQYDTGLGIDQRYENTPWHAVDNQHGQEFLLFDFGAGNEVAMQDFAWGYAQEDRCNCTGYDAQADATVLALTSAGAAGNIVDTLESKSLTAAGFDVIGHYLNVPDAVISNGLNTGEKALVSSAVYSRYWAIGTYISSLENSGKTFTKDGVTDASHYIDSKYDAGKLGSFTVLTKTTIPHQSVPLPATLALFGVGGLVMRRRVMR